MVVMIYNIAQFCRQVLKSLAISPFFLFFITNICKAQAKGDFVIQKEDSLYRPVIRIADKEVLGSPREGLWSIATAWEKDWPAGWKATNASKYVQQQDWHLLYGELVLPNGVWKFRDAYRKEGNLIKCIRRFEWHSNTALDSVTLSVKWSVKGNELQAFLPGILYYGNPSGAKNTPGSVPAYRGQPGELAIFEEHRYPMPFATLEQRSGSLFGSTLYTIPSALKKAGQPDHWWSLGVLANQSGADLLLLSGPIGYNGQHSVAKALQGSSLKYNNTFIAVRPGTVIEKTFYLGLHEIAKPGTAFQQPIYNAIKLFQPFSTNGLPEFSEIIQSKLQYAMNRYVDSGSIQGFAMYPAHYPAKHIVMGWCGQAASCGYALQQLSSYTSTVDNVKERVQKSLSFLTSSPVRGNGFSVLFDIKKNAWNTQNKDHVSMGQAMYNFAKAIEAARKNKKYDTKEWERFLKEATDFAAKRILDSNWSPFSTAEGFYIAPLVLAHHLFKKEIYKKAAFKAGQYYADRHISMKEPYWGGTLDASGEDKEGAWACFQGFLTLFEFYKEKRFLEWAKHAGDVCISYTVIWDIPLPPGRLADHALKTRGWTVVSPQNQHIDIYGVFFAPEVYKLGQYTSNNDLKKLAEVMFRSCGQLIDPFGSQGEQLQQTNFAQHGDMVDVYRLRGGYSESWNVFWITSHFLNAAARFVEMGVKL